MAADETINEPAEEKRGLVVTPAMVVAAKRSYEGKAAAKAEETPTKETSLEDKMASVQAALGEDLSQLAEASTGEKTIEESIASLKASLGEDIPAEEADVEEAVEEVAAEEAVEEIAVEEPAAEEPVTEEAVEEIAAEEPAAEEAPTEEAVAEIAVEEPAAEEAPAEEAVEEVADEEPLAWKPVAEEAAEEVVVEAPAAEKTAEEIHALSLKEHLGGNLDKALEGYSRALSLNPNMPDAYNCMAAVLREQGRLEAAIANYQRSLAIRPKDFIVQSCLGDVLREAGQLGASLVAHQRAIKMAPQSAENTYRMGLALRDLGQGTSAVACFEKALTMKPELVECRYDHALSLLRLGEYKKGFAEFEWRWKRPGNPPRRFSQPLWDGSDLTGRTILLHQEQTFGDMIQFVRYAPLVKEKGGAVVVECHPDLTRLFSTVPGVDKVVAGGGDLPDFDIHAPMLSLPRIFGTTLDTIPANAPYLSSPEEHDMHLPVPPETRLMVGIAWNGSPGNEYDNPRSCPLENFLQLMNIPDASFFSLQNGEPTTHPADGAGEQLIMDAGERIKDSADAAAMISQLDLVITVDTAVAHLAGALGQPVWVLLPFSAGWRWLTERDDSPWYPSSRLFRQSRPGHWQDVIDEVEKALAKLAER